jgi:hypothetical protein
MLKLRLGEDHADRAGFVRGKADSLGDRLSIMAGQTVKVEIAIPEASGGKTRPEARRHAGRPRRGDEDAAHPPGRQPVQRHPRQRA